MPQETYTDIVIAEARKRERARAYESALSAHITIKKALEKADAELAQLDKNLDHLDQFDAIIQVMHKDIPGKAGYDLRSVLIAQVGSGRNWTLNRREKHAKQLKALQSELPRIEATLKEFD